MKRKKRANGEGCIRLLPTGYWEARITNGYNTEGKQKFKTFTSKKQSVVIDKLNQFKKDRDKLSYNNVIKYTTGQWLNLWYENYVIDNVRPSTRVSYESIIKNHLIPYLGNIKLVNLKKVDIEKTYKDILKGKRKDNKKGNLSVKTLKNIHLTLSKSLKEAFKLDYISKNPAEQVTLPTLKGLNLKKKEIQIYSKAEEQQLIKVCKDDKIYGSVVIFALFTGMRKGEILGLQWDDIDFKNNIISVNKQLSRLKDYSENRKSKTKLCIQYNTKTSNSTREIIMLDYIKKLLMEQYKMQKQCKKRLGNAYYNYNMVFSREDGYYLDPDTVLSKYRDLAKKANIKLCTFHALRHTFATRALESKMKPKALSKILGHSNVGFTLDTYTHVLEDLNRTEMDKLDNYLKDVI